MASLPEPPFTLFAFPEHLPYRVRPAVPVDDEALFALCGLNRDLRIERTSTGELIFMPPTGGETGDRNSEINYQLRGWNRTFRAGRVFDSSTGFVLPNGAERAPDAAWVRQERWDALTDEERRRFPPLCPDLVVELASPTDRLDALHEKMREYAENGAEVGLLIDPGGRVVWIYRPGGAVDRLDSPERVEVGPLMPGFALEMAEIWLSPSAV